MKRSTGVVVAVGIGAAGLTTVAALLGHGLSAAGTARVAPQPVVARDAPGATIASTPSDAAPERRIVATLDSDPSLKESFDTVAAMAASSRTKSVIVGTVKQTTDLYVDGVAYRVLTVDLAEMRKPGAKRTVTVYEDGGVVPYSAVLPDLRAHAEQPLAAAGPNDYVDFRFLGAPHTEIGDQIVAFVTPNPNPPELIPADFQLVSSVQGLLVKGAGGTYVRRGVDENAQSGFERVLTPARLDFTLTASASKVMG